MHLSKSLQINFLLIDQLINCCSFTFCTHSNDVSTFLLKTCNLSPL